MHMEGCWGLQRCFLESRACVVGREDGGDGHEAELLRTEGNMLG